MARRGVGIGRTDFHNATIIGFMQRPVDKAAQSERTFKILASRTNAGTRQKFDRGVDSRLAHGAEPSGG